MKELMLQLITLCEGAVQMDSIRVEIGSDFIALVKQEAPNMITEIGVLRATLEAESDLLLPAVRVRDSVDLQPLQFQIYIHESEVAQGTATDVASAVATALVALKASALQHRGELTS
jgi:flagellar biosynthesis component FlhA